VIECQWALREGFATKDHKPYLVVLPTLNELFDDSRRYIETVPSLFDGPIRIEIERLHASRRIQHQDDVDPFGSDLGMLSSGLRSGHRHNQQCHGNDPQGLDNSSQSHRARGSETLQRPDAGVPDRGSLSSPLGQPRAYPPD
jgi:hypothetical protein